MEKIVTRCEECPMWSEDLDGSEYCSANGSPEMRYTFLNESPWVDKDDKKKIPDDCPLRDGEITIKLEQ